MANDSAAFDIPPTSPPSDAEYDSILTAIAATGRGGWFLSEYARRNRPADSRSGLSAIQRLEAVIAGNRSQQSSERMRSGVTEMAQAIAEAKAEIAALKAEAGRLGKIEEALDYLESQLKIVVDFCDRESPGASASEKQAAVELADEQRDASIEDIGRLMLMLEPTFPAEAEKDADVPHPAAIGKKPLQLVEADFPEEEVSEFLPVVEMTSSPPPASNPARETRPHLKAGDASLETPLPQASMAALDATRPVAASGEADPADFLLEPLPSGAAASVEKLPAQTEPPSPPPAAAIPARVPGLPFFPAPSGSKPEAPPQSDPLAPLRWLSEEARIALFS